MVQVDKTIEELMALNYHTVLYPHDDIATVIGRLKWVASWMKRGVVESGECDG
jgi:hypothetical protein